MKNKKASKTGSKTKSAENGDASEKDFLVVGLGASAGGVRALQQFFATMPPNSGMAFVVILHLSPNHESNLDHILQAQTAMPVIQVSGTHKVEPNHVYVIPPNQHLEMVDGVVRLAKKGVEHGSRAAIDVFFRTLAQAYERNAVCVVMSGTGSDGTLGLKRIKESNGFAIVQSPEDAEYDQMPRSAIATNLVDWVLPVDEMPDKLIHFKQSSERLHLTNGADAEKVAKEIHAEESLREILTVLRVRTGHDFSNYKTPTLVRRIARHLQIHELEDIPTYLSFLHDNPEEILSLQRNLLINVTNFFRDKEAFATLELQVIPHLFAGKTARDTVRVWSAGCASGEEAYSLAILLQEYASKLSDPPKFQVFATDVDDEAIVEAREHSYPDTIEADVSPERLRKFFTKENKRYRIRKELRETVLFAPHNILRDPPFSKLDLVSCRNLLIYLNRETQERVMEIFHFALTVDGFLFLGGSETAENSTELFTTFDKKQRIYKRRAVNHLYQKAAPQMPISGIWQVKAPNRKEIQARNKAFSLSEAHYKLLEKFAPPSALVNQDFEVMYLSENVGRYLRFAGGEPSNNILKLVLPELLPDLRAALFAAQHDHQSNEFPNIHLQIDGEDVKINLFVRTVDLDDEKGDLMLVIFEEVGKSQRLSDFLENDEKQNKPVQIVSKDDAMQAVVQRLEKDLQRSRQQLRATIEQHEVSIEELKASNEELQAINEELRSASEELETSKEELQSVNEELTTVNHELKDKIDKTTRVNSDLQNLMAATDIATIFLDRDLRIKRFTPPVEDLFNITKNDIGRPLAHFTHSLDYPDIQADATQVLKKLETVEREIADGGGRFFLTRFAPYRTLDDRINGVVLNFLDITERKRAEEVVAANLLDTQILHELSTRLISEEKVQTVYDEITAAAIRLTKADAGTVQIYDAQTKNLLLIATSGFKQTMTDHFAVVDAGSNTPCGIALANGKRTFVDFDNPKVRDRDGSMQLYVEAGYLSAQSTPLVSRTGKPIGMVTTHWKESAHRPNERELRFLDLLARQAADLIEQRQIERAKQESEERYRTRAAELQAVLESMSDAVYIGDTARIALANQTALDQLGYETLDELNRHVETFAGELKTRDAETGAPIPFEKQAFVRALGGENVVQEVRIRHRLKNEDRIVRCAASPIVIDGKVIGAIAVNTDITDRKRAEEMIHESNEQLRLVMESVADYAIITTDLRGIITNWNTGAAKIFGYSAQEIIGQSTDIIFTPEDRLKGVPAKEMQTALLKGRAEDERFHLRKDGSRFYVSGVMTTLRDGVTEGFVKVARDMTERMEAEKAMHEKDFLQKLVTAQEDERRRIARDIHDHFGQQITALRLKLDALKTAVGGDAEVAKFIIDAEKSAAELDASVDFIAWELRPAALDDLGLRAALTNFVNEWAKHTNIQAEFHSSGFGRTRLDFEIETNLYRIAQEALNNVWKHAGAGKASVLLEKSRNSVSLIIEDDGIGFNPNDKANRRKGIGLIGMIERAKICGGKLEIESAKGKGTTIFVRIPLKK